MVRAPARHPLFWETIGPPCLRAPKPVKMIASVGSTRFEGVSGLDAEREAIQANRVISLAKDRIFNQPHLTVQRIWCEYNGDQLTLRGQVPSFYHKQLAQVAVAGLDGVGQVVNEIEVLW
jgi:osmotically-inducible protein OsmY